MTQLATLPGTAPRPARPGRALRRGGTAAVVAGWLLVTLLVTVRLTVLDPGFYTAGLDRAHAYDRLYTAVLTDPELTRITDDLLARVPVGTDLVTDNLRVVLPPATLRAVVRAELAQLVDYAAARSGRVDLAAGLPPLLSRLRLLIDTYLPGALAQLPAHGRGPASVLRREIGQVVALALSGQLGGALPSIRLGPADARLVTGWLTATLPRPQRRQLAPRLGADFRRGDLGDALAAVIPAYVPGAAHARTDLRHQLGQVVGVLRRPVAALSGTPAGRAVALSRTVTASGWWPALAGGIALLLGGLVLVVAGARRAGRGVAGTALAAARALVAAGLAGLLAGAAVLVWQPDPLSVLVSPGTGLPPAMRHLLADVGLGLATAAGWTLLKVGALPALAGGAPLLAAALPGARRLRLRRRHVGLAARGTAAATLAGVAVVVVLAPHPTARPLSCDGSVQLCHRRYDQVAYAAAHNAYSTAAGRFLNPDQDVTLTDQLDHGVRALLIDTWYWSTPEQVASFLRGLPERTRAVIAPFVARDFGSHPGVWLCHVVCQTGAESAIGALRGVRSWLRAHPGQVVTLIVEDHTALGDTEQAFLDAGLGPMLATPPPPGRPWPTLGQLVRSGRRLVVFSQFHDDPGTWFRRFSRYAVQTPWLARSPAALRCGHRGGDAGRRLFLLNDFVTTDAPSHELAARVNRAAFVLGRSRRCHGARGLWPTYVAVDFATEGGVVAAVDRLNGVG